MEAKKSKNRIVDRVAILSEVGYDLDIFNDQAYTNLLKFVESDKQLTGIILDGAITRLDRPEIMSDALTYWNKTQEECDKASEEILNHEQYQKMMDEQLRILRERLVELKTRVPHAKIVLSIHTDDTQFSISAVLNEMLILRKSKLSESLKSLGAGKKQTEGNLRQLRKDFGKIETTAGLHKERKGLKRKIKSNEIRLDKIRKNIEAEADILQLFREKKVRPAHQKITEEHIKKLFSAYTELCDELGITLITRPSNLLFGQLLIKYAHSGHHTWTVVKTRDRQIVLSLHGKELKADIHDIVELLATTPENEEIKIEKAGLEDIAKDDKLLEAIAQKTKRYGVDVVLESGHHGIGFKQTQKVFDHPEATNFRHQASYAPTVSEEFITIVMALPFEDQERIDKYKQGKKPARMSGGIPMNTRSSEIFNRHNRDSVSGLTIIQKNGDGLIQTEWIQYQNFLDGSVLNQPQEYASIWASSDEHKCSPEENLIAQDGLIKLFTDNTETPFAFRGKPAYARGYINGGDVGEANSRKWNHRYHRKPDPTALIQQIVRSLTNLDNKRPDDVAELSLLFVGYALAGSVESMRDVLQRVAEYFSKFLKASMKQSKLQWLHVSVPGNHVDDVLRDLGLKETDFFVERLEALGMGVCEVGIADHFKVHSPAGARVFIGGYSSARILHIPQYGLDTDGNTMFGPINLLVQHDPKGSGFSGMIGAGKSVGANMTISGHTHENYLKLYKTENNTFSAVYRLATLQGVTPTEKYYASSVPRTQAGHWLIMPMRGDFAEMCIPVNHLNKIGLKVLHDYVQSAVKK